MASRLRARISHARHAEPQRVRCTFVSNADTQSGMTSKLFNGQRIRVASCCYGPWLVDATAITGAEPTALGARRCDRIMQMMRTQIHAHVCVRVCERSTRFARVIYLLSAGLRVHG